MRKSVHRALTAVGLMLATVGCASTATTQSVAADLSRPGFYTEVRNGRLWVFREGSPALEEFKKQGEPAHQVTRVGAGPRGMTIKSSEGAVIDEYLAAK